MWYAATVNCFDLIDKIHVSAVIRQHAIDGVATTVVVWQGSATFDGVGEADPHRWLSDALVGLLETL